MALNFLVLCTVQFQKKILFFIRNTEIDYMKIEKEDQQHAQPFLGGTWQPLEKNCAQLGNRYKKKLSTKGRVGLDSNFCSCKKMMIDIEALL